MLYMILAVLSGAMISAQSSYNGMLYPFIGVLGVGFISQFLNALTSLALELGSARKFPKPKGMPLRACLGGVCAIFVLGFSGYLVARLGSAVTVCLSVSGQGMLFLLLIFAIFIGCVTVFARMFNYEASRYVGKVAGSFYNSGFGAVVAFLLLLFATGYSSGFQLAAFGPALGRLASGFQDAPLLGYLTGPLGAVVCAGIFLDKRAAARHQYKSEHPTEKHGEETEA